jgi:hypothetical protein
MAELVRRTTIGRLAATAALLAAAVVAACAGDSTGPSQPLASPQGAAFSKGSSNLSFSSAVAQGLLWEKPRSQATTASKIISSKGGTIEVKGTGLRLQVPRGAVSVATRFTITALPGNVVAYDFQPHGSVFPVPLKFVQDLSETNFKHVKVPAGFVPSFEGAYFTTSLLIDQLTGVAIVDEVIPATTEITFSGKAISFPISHFSGYMISTGRTSR